MAKNQQLMLDTLSREYHAFRKDQLLTHTQLNELIDYFEDQDRLSRTLLTGVGLVCGLGILINPAEPSVTVEKGCAITTDGDMLVMDKTIYRHFRPYTNRQKDTNTPIYDPFFPQGLDKPQMNLWELVLPAGDGSFPADTKALSQFTVATTKNAADMVAMLYLEFYLQEPDKCTAVDCDHLGAHQVAVQRVLLLEKADMEKVINRNPSEEIIADGIFKRYYDAAAGYFNLPVIKARKVLLNDVNTTSIKALTDTYRAIPQTEGAKLVTAIGDLYNACKYAADPDSAFNITVLQQQLQQALATNPKIYQVQYVYDFYRDVVDAYNELRHAVYGFALECCPDKYSFPKHIMLGELVKNTKPVPMYRHRFYPSPVMSDAREKWHQCQAMWRRLAAMIQGFSIPDQPSDIRITPSAGGERPLENRAIPFYYKNPKDLVQYWNYLFSRRGIGQTVNAYHAAAYAEGNDIVLNPLDYDTDANDFYRIEGHLGKKLSEAMAGIDKIRKGKGVPFDLVALRLNKGADFSEVNTADFDCQFEDLNVVLQGWLIEQNCLLADITRFFTGFSFKKDKNYHTRIEDYKPSLTPVVFAARPAKAGAAASLASASFAVSRVTALQPVAARTSFVSGSATTAAKAATLAAFDAEKDLLYIPNKVISTNIETSPDALGKHFAEALKKPIASADDMIAEVKRITANNADLALLPSRDREIVYEVPVALVSYANALSLLKPFSMNELNTGILDKYMDLMDKLCAYVKKLESRIDAQFNSISYQKQGFENYYLFLLRQIITHCCSADKLEILQKEIEERKQKILDGLLLTNYAAGNPGLEHKGGVPTGGTFVLVYAREVKSLPKPPVITTLPSGGGTSKEDDDPLEPFETPPIIYRDLDNFAYHLATNQGKVDLDTEIDNFAIVNRIRKGSLAEEQFTKELTVKVNQVSVKLGKEQEAAVADFVVMADFCLPYLCCSNCPPVTFIVPREQFVLLLPVSQVCSDESPIEFRKQPLDGEVKAITPGFEAAIVNINSKSFFDPTKVLAANYGKEAEFTINGQVTGCRITVMKHPAASFTTAVSETAAEVTVKYTNTSDDATGKAYIYEWNFGDNRPLLQADNKNEITIVYRKSTLDALGLNGKIPVTLKAVNGPCSHTTPVTHVAYTKEVPVSLSLPATLVCRTGTTPPMPFTVQPGGAVVKSVNAAAAVVTVNGVQQFDPKLVPANVLGTAITFTVNDKPVAFSITVQDKPKAAFGFQAFSLPSAPNMMQVTFTNQTVVPTGQIFNFLWSFSDKRTRATTSPQPFTESFNIDVLKLAGQTQLTVDLRVENGLCGDLITQNIPFITPPPVVCADVTAENTKRTQNTLNTELINKYLNEIEGSTEFNAVVATLNNIKTSIAQVLADVNKLTDPLIQRSQMNRLASNRNSLIQTGFKPNTNRFVLSPCMAAVYQTMLDTLRCTSSPDTTAMDNLTSAVKAFNGNPGFMATKFPLLNDLNRLTDFIDKWLSDTQIKDAGLLDAVKLMYQNLMEFFTEMTG